MAGPVMHAATEPWMPPRFHDPVRATVSLPGSKSLTNRALVLAALADRPSVVRRALRSRDTALMSADLSALGARVDDSGDDWTVTPGPLAGPAAVDCGLAGTVMRFVPPVAGLADGRIAFDGDEHMRLRPVSTVLDALRTLGVKVDDGGRGSLPFAVDGEGSVPGGQVVLDASGSSQFVSALLLAGARFDHGVDADLHHVGELTPVIAALCALADGPSHLRGIAHIRGHETDRLAALAREPRGLGADVTEHEDGLSLRPATMHGGLFHTYADHRMAHAGVVVGAAVDDVACTGKTFPDFAGTWSGLLP